MQFWIKNAANTFPGFWIGKGNGTYFCLSSGSSERAESYWPWPPLDPQHLAQGLAESLPNKVSPTC